ncbi:hypothetical protein D1227_05630 [Henriciella mobilis]|uniref:hypothetical protein n=1 Tax=Henriciella mobilis TaxID=2305467 RepID=UPI000E66171A|nr:hypothetical protein [Henriciella mobilis]RIJ16105.1 hypothetical protein D1231_09970 [Henriciella mobilis]RIJ22983.1 hypothetical protein D1227_05630 [Henriciella mobilis]
MSSFTIFAIGYAILIAGLAWGAFALGVSGQWIAIGSVILAGIGIITGVTSTRRRDKTDASMKEG